MAAWLTLGWVAVKAENTPTQPEAESRLKQLKSEISSLKKELDHSRSTLSDEQKSLRATDLEIQVSVLALRELESTRQEHDRELSALHTERQNYLRSIDKRREVLATQIMTAYRLGRESRLKLVLNQDSPALLSRTLAYYAMWNCLRSMRFKRASKQCWMI